jgi:hypothetical protein
MPESSCDPSGSGQSQTGSVGSVPLQIPAGAGPEYPQVLPAVPTATSSAGAVTSTGYTQGPGPAVGSSTQLSTGFSRQVVPGLPEPSLVPT